MLKTFAVIISIFLIIVILLQIPKENIGITAKSNILGSSNSARGLLQVIISLGILIYIAIAIKLNLTNS